MVKQTINVGTIPNDSTGDTLRVAFTKVNTNFTELYANNAALSDVAFSGSYTDLLNIPTFLDSSGRLINGSQELVLGANGTLTISSPTSNEFPLTFSSANYVPTVGKPTLTLTTTPWSLTGQYVYAPDGECQLFLDNIWPELVNPGYTSGDTLTFDSTVHGVAGFVLTIQLNNVVQAGQAGWTVNVAASQPPAYASTIESLGAIKLTSSDSSWIFGTDGKLHYPDGTFSDTAFVGNATTAEVLVNQDNATITTGPVLGTQYVWDFGTDGKLTLPDTSMFESATSTSITSGTATLALKVLYTDAMAYLTEIFSQTTNSTQPEYPWGITLPFPNANFAYAQLSQLPLSTFRNLDEVLEAADIARGLYLNWLNALSDTNTTITVSDSSWTFDSDGIITLPDGTTLAKNINGANTVGFGSAPNSNFIINTLDTSVGLQKTWIFGEDGNLTLPTGGDILDSTGTSVLGGAGGGPTVSTDIYKFSSGVIGTKNNPDTGGWGDYNIVLDPGGESYAGLFIPSVASQDAGNSLNIYNNKVIGNNIALSVNSGSFVFKGTGTLELPHPTNLDYNDPSIKFGESTSVSTNNLGFAVPASLTGVVYVSRSTDLLSMKLLVTIQGIEDGGDGNFHTQICEMLVVRRTGATINTVNSVVYGVTYTSVGPLATITAQEDTLTGRINILATPTNSTGIGVKVHATEVINTNSI